MRYVSILLATSLMLIVQSCSKKEDCEKNNTGSIFIQHDESTLPLGESDFYLETGEFIGSVENGYVETFDGLPVGSNKIYVLYGTDTLFWDNVELKECKTLSFATSSWDPTSDRTLKQNIKPLTNVLSQLQRLEVYSYAYDDCVDFKQYLSKGKHYGFMAQELVEVYPSFTSTDDEGFYHVNYDELLPILTKGIQEQQLQIQALQNELNDLKRASN